MTHPPDANVSLDANVVELWKKYEDVAMHFNDLIMRWRLQVIGGLAGLVTLAGFVVGDAATVAVNASDAVAHCPPLLAAQQSFERDCLRSKFSIADRL